MKNFNRPLNFSAAWREINRPLGTARNRKEQAREDNMVYFILAMIMAIILPIAVYYR